MTSVLQRLSGAQTAPRPPCSPPPPVSLRLSRRQNYTSQGSVRPRELSVLPGSSEASRKNHDRFAGQCGWEKHAEASRGPPLLAHPAMARMQDEQRGGAPLMAEGKSHAEVKLILYHWTHSFSSQKVKGLGGGGPRGSGFSTGTAPSGRRSGPPTHLETGLRQRPLPGGCSLHHRGAP